MLIRTYIKFLVILSLSSVMLFPHSIFGQSSTNRSDQQKEGSASDAKPGRPENKVAAEEPRPNEVLNELSALKAENAAFREVLRKMEEQQKTLLEQVDRLTKRLDTPSAEAQVNGQPLSPNANDANTAVATNSDDASTQPPPAQDDQPKGGFYNDGMILWQTSDDAKVPFLLRFTNNTQVRYLNTLSSNDTFTDHLGVVREVHKRNDITVNRSMFVLNGYVFDKRLLYNLTVWTSAGAASIVVAGNIGWRFNKRLTLTGGYTGVPGSRSLVNTFPFFT